MTFLAPMLLLGGLAVSIPIILHFFYKARYRPLPWAAMRFLKQAIEQTSRRLRFQEYVLLALRCLGLLLLTLALARPSCTQFNLGGRGESVDAVLLFDTSYSMGARDGEKTRLERAQESALSIIDNLPPNSTIQIFGCADRVKSLGPRTPANLDQARQIVQNLTLTSLNGDASPGLNQALTALDSGAGTNKEVYIFSDFQKSGWDNQAAAVREKADELKKRASVIFVRCGNPERPVANVAITDLTYPGQIPHTDPERPTRLPVTIVLKNTGKTPVRNLSVTLEIDGRLQEKESGSVEVIGPDEFFPVTLTAKLDQPGLRLITARVTGDELPGDNRLDKLLLVRDKLRVVVVDGSVDPRDPKQSSSHFVKNALLPVSTDQVNEYFVRVSVVTPDEAGAGLLKQADVCILCNVAASNTDRPGIAGLSAEFVAGLQQFVKEGGGLIVGVGDNLLSQRYNSVLGSAGANLLPFDLQEPITAELESPLKPGPDSTEANSFLNKFRDEPFRSVIADVEVRRMVPLVEQGAGRVLVRLTNQKPWISTRNIGDGEVVFVGTSLDESWTNWPAKGGAYLTFLQFTMAHLTNRTQRGVNRVAGETIVWNPTEANTVFELLGPDSQRTTLGKPTGELPKLSLNVPETALAGVYRVGTPGEDPPSAARFAVTPDLRDSVKLDLMSDAEIEEILGFKPVIVLAGSESQNTFADQRNRREWTVWVLMLLFVVVVGESFWAWFCGKAW
jgi:hypothetical protein